MSPCLRSKSPFILVLSLTVIRPKRLESCVCVCVRERMQFAGLSVKVFESLFFFLLFAFVFYSLLVFVTAKSVTRLALHVTCRVCRRSGSPRQHCDTHVRAHTHAGFLYDRLNESTMARRR